MANLNDIFNAPKKSTIPSPLCRYDYMQEKAKEYIRFRFGTEFDKLELLVRHWVTGVGQVACGQTPTMKSDGTLGLFGECEYCARKRAMRDDLKNKAIADGQPDMSKDDAKKCGDLYRREVALVGEAEIEVRIGKKVIKELAPHAIKLKVMDGFSSNGKGYYKQLASIFENKGTIMDRWFTLGKGTLTADDPLKDGENTPIEGVDLTYFDKTTIPYADGVAKLGIQKNAVGAATPMDDDIEEGADF